MRSFWPKKTLNTPRDGAFTDSWTLPNQNGFETAHQIHQRSPHIPIVFMSGYYDQAVAEAAHLDISSTILQKPFAMADLLAHLQAAYAASKPVEP